MKSYKKCMVYFMVVFFIFKINNISAQDKFEFHKYNICEFMGEHGHDSTDKYLKKLDLNQEEIVYLRMGALNIALVNHICLGLKNREIKKILKEAWFLKDEKFYHEIIVWLDIYRYRNLKSSLPNIDSLISKIKFLNENELDDNLNYYKDIKLLYTMDEFSSNGKYNIDSVCSRILKIESEAVIFEGYTTYDYWIYCGFLYQNWDYISQPLRIKYESAMQSKVDKLLKLIAEDVFEEDYETYDIFLNLFVSIYSSLSVRYVSDDNIYFKLIVNFLKKLDGCENLDYISRDLVSIISVIYQFEMDSFTKELDSVNVVDKIKRKYGKKVDVREREY